MTHLLISWIGQADLNAADNGLNRAGGTGQTGQPGPASDYGGPGPVAQALGAGSYDGAILISDYPKEEVATFLDWLRPRSEATVTACFEPLSGPTQFGEIYEAAVRVLDELLEHHGKDARLTFHLSPGTPAMAAVWIILAKTRFPAELIESSPRHGVQVASVPFDISAEFLPDLLRGPDERLRSLTAGLPPEAPEFADIIHRSDIMARVIAKARRVAPRSVPVLIEGESGTGKELFARAIHRASPRRGGPFQAVNCGAIPAELVESELFGHEKGAFTGADMRKAGHFEAANGGTLFLDEVGELPLPAQVKLLRTLQEGTVLRVGSTRPVAVDVRIVAATNRTLTEEIAEGRFREDLFYRLAVAGLRLPPLRERSGDLNLLLDRLLDQVNDDHARQSGFERKTYSVSARNIMLNHSWPGNVRELMNTLHRLAIWTPGPEVVADDVREALLPPIGGKGDRVLDRPMDSGFSLPDLLAKVARHYLERALDATGGNKTRAARLVGLPSYQTFTNWMKRYGVAG